MLEYMFLELGFGFRVALEEIFAIMPLDIYGVKQLYLDYLRQERLYRATKGRKGRSLILLNNGTAFVSSLTTDELNKKVREEKWIKRGLEESGT